jgi:hypothetical protein
MGGVELMNDLEIMDRQAKLIEDQRRLFKSTVEQFKKDVTFLRGCLANSWSICDKDEPLRNGLEFSLRHLEEMESMLNEFEYRMKDYE